MVFANGRLVLIVRFQRSLYAHLSMGCGVPSVFVRSLRFRAKLGFYSRNLILVRILRVLVTTVDRIVHLTYTLSKAVVVIVVRRSESEVALFRPL